MYLLRLLVETIVIAGVLPAVLIFSIAGRWDLWNVWAYVGILTILFCYHIVALYRKNPDLLKEREKPPSHGRAWWTITITPAVMYILQPIVAGLDHRYHWSDIIPLGGVIAGLVIVVIGLSLLTWAMFVNPFFSGAIRIQADRGQRVIHEGPYAFLRHPGHAGGILAFLAAALALNSLLSILPVVVIMVPIVVYRTIVEEQMLRDELAGYADYAAKVPYRLIPGIW
jgi:protein-S-isoprenylcysteine O-methyltransferase Ste14